MLKSVLAKCPQFPQLNIDSGKYSLKKEFEDVVAVVRSMPGPVAVLGHSYGGVCAIEAALLSKKISQLVLYEPPIQDLDHAGVADTMEKMILSGQRDQAFVTFLRDVVRVSPTGIDLMRSRPDWKDRVSGVDVQLRELRALSKYRFQQKKVKKLNVPTLLITGSRTASPQLKEAIQTLMTALPNRTVAILEGQEHNAMDNIPKDFADIVTKFLLGGTIPGN